ncbi:MAG: DUF177 domain-containing protein [Chlorobi bacterium]|nr:DUF177 domain-containing protein [Chlorobiota bacterium]
MSKFKIRFRGLKEGKYNYKFEINDSFFENYPESEISKANIQAYINLSVTKDLLTLTFKFKGTVRLRCDRCLDFFEYGIKGNSILYVDFGEKNSDLSDADNKITISNTSEEIILDKHLYDYIHLNLPYQRVHPDDKNGNSTCNREMLNKIEEYSAGNEQKTTDPRWDKLKSLYN